MSVVGGFLKKVDFFGVSFSFKYQEKEKFTTSLGGIISIIFITICLAFGIYNFIPFYNRKNFTTIYYTLKLPETEQIFFDKSKIVFSIGLNCWTGNDGTKADDLFDVIFKYIYWDIQNGEYKRRIDYIETHTCTYADFYNDFDKAFDDSKIYNYQCLNDLSRTIEGIYASPVFSYYEFNVNAKNNSDELLNKIENYLKESDCKLQIYYIDNTIDIDDYKNPIKHYLETDFIQLNPTLSIRKNMYFMNQHLYDDDSYIWFFNDQHKEETKLSSVYSRYEEYGLYQGLNRTNSTSDHLNWAKLFFRADTRKIDVKRKYQSIMEFYADVSSLLIGIFRILLIIFNFINQFYAELDLSKKIFFFKELNGNNFNINKYTEKVNDLLSQTTSNANIKVSNLPTEYVNNRNKGKINPSSNAYTRTINSIENNKKKNFGKKRKANIEVLNVNKYEIKNSISEISKDELKTNRNQINIKSIKKNKENIYKKEDKKELDSNKMLKLQKRENYDNIKLEFNIFEIINLSICKCCLMKRLKPKNDINEKSCNILNDCLDIVCFVQNNMLFNIVNETILDEHTKSIVNFLSRPIISKNIDINKNGLEEFYRSYKEEDFNKFYDDLIQLSQKPQKEIREKKLLNLANKHIKNFLISDS